MKKVFTIIISLFLLISCSDNSKTTDKMTNENPKDTISSDLWPSINLKAWAETPAINGRLATETDVKNGLAVYYINNNGVEHKPYEIQLPKLAYLTDFDTKKEKLIVVIQIEETASDIVVGYRNIEGGNGACLLNEIKFLEKETIKKVVGR